MAKDKDTSKEKRELPPGSVFINIEPPGQDYTDSIDFGKLMEQQDISQRSERAARMKWTMLELPSHAHRPTSVGYPLGPWITPYEQAQQCYIYGLYRAAIAMSGSIAESMCLTLLKIVAEDDKRNRGLGLSPLIEKIEKKVDFLDPENLERLKRVNKIRNKWVHKKSDELFTGMIQALKQEESAAKPAAERILILIHEVLGSLFELRPADGGAVQILVNARRKE
jgi:hypothetical protein